MITITEKAAEKVKALLAQHQDFADPGLRLQVADGGCAGYQYKLAIEDGPQDEDTVIEGFGARVFVDRKSEFHLGDMEIDYEDGILRSGFKFHNPTASRSCKCGESFAV